MTQANFNPRQPASGSGFQAFGKYRGKVANNIDPLNLGRVQVTCSAR